MIVNVIPNRTDVIGRLFRERERLSNQSAAPLAQCLVEAFNMRGLATLLANRSMALEGQNSRIGLPEIGVTDGTLTIDGRKAGPQLACRRFGSCANRNTHN